MFREVFDLHSYMSCNRLTSASISDSLPLEVLINTATPHELACDNAHKAADDFILSEEVLRLNKAILRKF